MYEREELETHSEDAPFLAAPRKQILKPVHQRSWSYIMRCSVGAMLIVLYTASVALLTNAYWGANDIRCTRRLSAWSPANEAVQLDTVKFDAAFHAPSRYKGASPEVDAAWNDITRIDGFFISESDIVENLHKQSTAVKTDKGYLVWLEVFHQLHCLNLLRKWVHPEYYNNSGDVDLTGSPPIQRAHIDHCVDLLRIVLMCNADTTLLTFHWIKGIDTPSPDFENEHKCRNYDRIRTWARGKSAESGYTSLKKPPGVFELDVVP